MCSRYPANQRGVSLIEVLVSVLVLSFGLLGLAALQTNALRNNQSSFQRTVAVMLTYYITDAIRIDRTNIASYSMGKTCTVPSSGSGLAPSNQKKWLEAIQSNMGDTACGQITCNTNDCTVTIFWNDERAIGGRTEQQLEMRTRI
ncbi:MAG: type IV pilus modification protein PilV [Dechloromonas sp.]|nr:MAG: type IV pilus modification protein PilV [Dechloromonas sp.]